MKFILKSIMYGLTIFSPVINMVNNTLVSGSEITSPELDSTWLVGNSYPIEWNNLDSNSIQIQLGVQTNLSNNEWKFEDESGHDYLSVMYDSRLNYYEWNIPLTMIHLWEYPLKIFIKEIDTGTYVTSQQFNIAGISVESPSLNQSFLEYDTIPITWSFNSMFNSFNISLCDSNVNIYNINISHCEYNIIQEYQPNTIETNSGEITYNWIIPELIDTYQDYKILISSINNTIMMLSSSFTIENNPSTTPTTTLTTTATSTITSSTLTTTNNIYPPEPDTYFPVYIPILTALGSILFIYLIIYLFKTCIQDKKPKSNRIRPTEREFYNNNYESNYPSNYKNRNVIQNTVYDSNHTNNNNNQSTNYTYESDLTRFNNSNQPIYSEAQDYPNQNNRIVANEVLSRNKPLGDTVHIITI